MRRTEASSSLLQSQFVALFEKKHLNFFGRQHSTPAAVQHVRGGRGGEKEKTRAVVDNREQ